MKHIFLISAFVVTLALVPPSHAQEAAPLPARYTLEADEIVAEVDNDQNRTGRASGNAVLTYWNGQDEWRLSADEVVYTERRQMDVVTAQNASASGRVTLTGPGFSLNASGEVIVDILNGQLHCENKGTHVVFDDGEIETDALLVSMTKTEEGTFIEVATSLWTSASYSLAGSPMYGTSSEASSGSMFASIDFDFARISLTTETTVARIVEGTLVQVECPGETSLSSSTGRLTLPYCRLTFAPPRLESSGGVMVEIPNGTIEAESLTFTYPPEGGMFMELRGGESPVTISHRLGVFTADVISFSTAPDGSRKMEASGRTRFEAPVGSILRNM